MSGVAVAQNTLRKAGADLRWLLDKAGVKAETDARVIRVMVYVWLMMEMDAIDYLATVFPDTAAAPFDLHYDLARHLWDESRHSQFGFRQLPRLGVDLMTVEHSLDLSTTSSSRCRRTSATR